MLTDDQQKAFAEIKEFISGKETSHCLAGYGGTGKTFLTRYILAWCQQRNISVAGLAPTHKARKVLESNLTTSFGTITQTMTVASFLNKLKQHSYVGTKNFRGYGSKADQYDLFLIDECSMICDKDVDEIVKHIKSSGKKALFIGDPGQIPSPSQEFEENKDGTISKKDSKAFQCKTSHLTEIKRQQDDHPLLDIYTEIRKNIFEEPDIPRENNVIVTPMGNKGVKFYQDHDRFLEKIKRTLVKLDPSELIEYRVISYTNDSVQLYNKYVRDVLNYQEQFVINDVLVGYNNVGFPIHIVENGQEYYVNSIKHHKAYIVKAVGATGIETFNCSGTQVGLKDLMGRVTNVFFPNVTDPGNVAVFTKLKDLAKNVNKKGSTLKEFKWYSALKNQLLFMENLYEYGGKVFSEKQLKESQPLLFHQVNYYILYQNGKLVMNNSKATDKFNQQYPNMLQERITDNKAISDSEKIIDRFQLIEKDIDYGYAITAHKAQGSTYHTVFINEKDFSKIGNRWNPRLGKEENGTKEKNQLRYVAYTRPTFMAAVFY
jgi:hypothetical protein